MPTNGSPWHNAHVVVTGASSGIGRELARQMAKDARALTLVARREDRLRELEKELRETRSDLEVFVRATNLADLADCERMLDDVEREVGAIEVLVNNAGFGDMGAFDLSDWPKLEQMIALNVTSLTYLSHRVLPKLIARGRGGILNLSSGFGLAFLPGLGVYIGTKHYVSGLSEVMHGEAEAFGVTITQVCPGPVATEFEAIAGNFTGQATPSWIEISAAQCARESLDAFARGRALVVPGFAMKLLMWSNAFSPRWIKRLIYRPVAKWMREREVASKAGAKPPDEKKPAAKKKKKTAKKKASTEMPSAKKASTTKATVPKSPDA